MTPRIPLTSKGILFLARKTLDGRGNTKHSQTQEQRALPREKGLPHRPVPFQQRQLQLPDRGWSLPRNPLSLKVHLPLPAGPPHLGCEDPQGSHPTAHCQVKVIQKTWTENEILNISNSNL